MMKYVVVEITPSTMPHCTFCCFAVTCFRHTWWPYTPYVDNNGTEAHKMPIAFEDEYHSALNISISYLTENGVCIGYTECIGKLSLFIVRIM